MFTIMWKHKDGEELYGAHGVSLLNKDSEGPDRIAFQHYVVALGEPVPVLSRSVIGTGDVFVMNDAGKTVATYRFGNPD